MNYERIYEYRFRGVDQRKRGAVWEPIAHYIHEQLGGPDVVLDPAAGRGEFINAVPAKERWAVDQHPFDTYDSGVKSVVGSALDVDLPEAHFDAVFVSNFLEHLTSQEQIATFLEQMRERLREGGTIAVMGPNFRFCAREYFDMADHTLALTHRAVEEHLHAAGFVVVRVVPRFLPYSFTGILPPSPRLTKLYLRLPFAWRLLGKQFLIVACRR